MAHADHVDKRIIFYLYVPVINSQVDILTCHFLEYLSKM